MQILHFYTMQRSDTPDFPREREKEKERQTNYGFISCIDNDRIPGTGSTLVMWCYSVSFTTTESRGYIKLLYVHTEETMKQK